MTDVSDVSHHMPLVAVYLPSKSTQETPAGGQGGVVHQQPEVNYLPCFENDDLPCRLHEKHVVCRENHRFRNRVNSSLQVAGGCAGARRHTGSPSRQPVLKPREREVERVVRHDTTPGPSNPIPRTFLEPLGRSWSHFVGIYHQKLSNLQKLTFD